MSDFTSEFDEGYDNGSNADGSGPATEPTHDEPADLLYTNPLEFFTNVLGPSYVREVNGGSEFVWCPQWYKHVEALSRVETVWRAWEHLRLEGALGLSTWWLNHADPHMRMLMAPNGPFKKCIHEGNMPRDRPEMLSLPHIEPEVSLYPKTIHTQNCRGGPINRRDTTPSSAPWIRRQRQPTSWDVSPQRALAET